MKRIIYLFSFLLVTSLLKSQALRINSVLVDACVPGSGCTSSVSPNCNCEGKNEMVLFTVGSTSLNVSGIFMKFYSNTFKGISPVSVTTSSLTYALDTTIKSCGYLKQPVGGILPANSKVLIILSTDMCTSANSFANLNDTLILLFQNPGNYQGHFANTTNSGVAASTPNGISQIRFLEMSYAALSFTQNVTYDCNLLVNQLGTYRGNTALNDGAAVDYDAFGNPTYVNRGCQAPFIPLSITASPSSTICAGSSIVSTASVNGSYSYVHWSGGSGTFSSPSSLTTTYTPAISELGSTITLSCIATKTCGTQTTTAVATKSVTYLQQPIIGSLSSTNGYSLCPLGSTVLSYSLTNPSATGTLSTAWSSPAASTSTYAVSAPTGTAPVTYTLSLTDFCGVTSQTVNVYPLASPSVTISVPTLTACAGNTVAVNAVSNSGNYSWNNPAGATTASVVLTANTTTTGVVTTTNTCGTKTDSYTLTVIPQSTVTISPSSVSLCTGQSATVTASANTAVTYTWSGTGVNGLNTNTVSLNTAGTYTVASSSVCNTSTAQVNVVVNSTPTLSVATTNTLLCGGATATLSLAGSTGTYSWSNGATTSTTSVNAAGTYTAMVTTSSCGSTTASIVITAALIPSVSVNSNSVTICTGQSTTLTATSNISNYLWSTSATTNTISVNTAGTYTVGSTNACGTSTESIVVSIAATPTLSINTPSLTLCAGSTETLTLSGSTGTYAWSAATSTASSLPITTGGIYTATVTTLGCGSATAAVTIASLQSPTLTVASNTAIVCNNTPIVLTATSTYTNNYSWLPLAASTNTLQVLTPLVYTVTSTNSCGSDTQTVTVTSGTTPVLTVTPTSTVVCPGNTVSISATGGTGNYNWTGVSSTSSVVSVSSGTYIVLNTNACGTGSQTVVVNTSTVSAGLDGTPTSGTSPLSVSFSNLSSGATTYTWNYGNGVSSNGVFPVSQTYTAAGVYTVVLSVTNSDGCENSQSILITVKNEDATLVIPNVFTPNNDSINDLFYVKATNIADFNCVIFDRWGLQFYSWSDLKGGWDGKTAGKDATDGTYFFIINATDTNGKEVKRQGSFLLIR